MGLTAGTSPIGLQFLNTLTTTEPRFCNVLTNQALQNGRLTRLGTILVCFRYDTSQLAVASVYRINGNGIVLGKDPIWPSVNLEVWANWFVQGVEWRCQTSS